MKQAVVVFVGALLVLLGAERGNTRVWYEGSGSCGGVVMPDTLPDPLTGWDPLGKYHRYGDWAGEFDISTVNPTFANIFDLWVTESVVARWDSAMVADMTFRVVDGDSTNDADVFPKVWKYFLDDAVDEDPTYGGIRYTFSDDSTYTRLILRLWDPYDFTGACGYIGYGLECGGYATALRPPADYAPYRAYNILVNAPDSLKACDGPVRPFTVDEFANTFGHELQHVCFSLNGHSTQYYSVNESLSKLAEYVIGSVPNSDCDISYDSSILRGDRCEATRKYAVEEIWMSYLYDRFPGSTSDPEDDLAYNWLREDDVTLSSLADLLEDSAFSWLGGSTGDERFQALFRSFAVARFANAPGLTSDHRYGYEDMDPVRDLGLTLDNCTWYAPGACRPPSPCGGALPPGCTTSAGCWNVQIIPPDYGLGGGIEDATAMVSGIYQDADLSKDSVEVATYGADYIEFRADSYYNDGEQHELRFNVNKLAGTMPSNSQLQATVVAYDVLADTLQLHPENILFVSPLQINSDGAGASCTITDFGRSVKAVVVVLSLVEDTVAAASASDIKYYVYEYEYGVFTPGISAVPAWEGDVFVSGDYEIPTGRTLTILPGTDIHVWTDDLADDGISEDDVEIVSYGSVVAVGTSSDPITFGAWDMAGASSADDSWWGLTVASGGSGHFEHCQIRNAQYALQSNDNLVVKSSLIEMAKYRGISVAYAESLVVDSTTITGPDYGVNVLLGPHATITNSTIEDCPLYGVAVYKDAILEASGNALNGNDVGLYLSSETEDWVRANVHDCSFDENNDAIWIEDVGDSLVVIDNCSVTNSTTNGIYIQGAGDVEITRNAISDGTIGIYCYQSSPDIRSRNVIEGNGAGIKCDYYAYAAVESCTVTGNTNGVAVVNYANPDLGHVSGGTSLGANILNANTTYFVSNLTGNTISAENNYWGGLSPNCYPKGTKIYGSVDYAPALCTAPALAPAFMEVPAAEADVPTRFALSQNYPNPFNPVTTVTYSVPNPGGFVRIELFDVAGRLVTRLVNEQKSAGVYQAIWNGRNEKGQPAATGVYFVRMQSGSFVETRKLLMLK